MKRQISKKELVNYINEQVKNLYKLHTLKEEKSKIENDLKVLNENKYTKKASEFIGKEISHLQKDKGYKHDRAVAAALNVAKDKGYKVPKPTNEIDKSAMKAAKKDIEAAGHKFEPLGKSRFEKDINKKDLEKAMSPEKTNEIENKKKIISLNVLTNLAKNAGDIVPDAESELYELGAAYGDKIPLSRVMDILNNYDIEFKEVNKKREKEEPKYLSIEDLMNKGLLESGPSAGLSAKQKSNVVKKAKAGEDIGKKGKGFKDVEAKAKAAGADDPKAVAAAAMWKNIKREGKKLNEGLTEKGIATVEKWIAEKGARGAGVKMIDSVLNRMIGLSSSDLADTATFANGLDEIESMLEEGDYNAAFEIAKDTAREMVDEEGGGDLFGESDKNESWKDNDLAIVKIKDNVGGTKWYSGPRYAGKEFKVYRWYGNWGLVDSPTTGIESGDVEVIKKISK